MRGHRHYVIGAGLIVAAIAARTAVQAYTAAGSWAASTVVYYVNPANLDVAAGAAAAAVQAGADVWGSQSQANFRFVYGGTVSDTAVGYDNRPVVIFRNASKDAAIATTYSWYSGTTLLDADIVFWDASFTFFTGSAGCSGGAYIEDIAAHEFGHALGLKHSGDGDATMYASYGWCSQKQRTLAADDIAGVEFLYPPSGSNSAPSIAILAPGDGAAYPQGASITFTGSARDREDGDLSSRIVWTSTLDGQFGTGAAVSRTLSPGTHTITASVSDNRGATSAAQLSVRVDPVSNTAPSVAITSPGHNSAFAEGTAIAFSGWASDPEDGSLTGRLTWTSSRDGRIGTGASFTRALSVGTHTIVASVSDSGGRTGSAQVAATVYVPVNAPPRVSITAPANNTSVPSGTSITFQGTATDPEDGSLSSRLVWSSNVDGPLGMGGTVSKVLSPGAHTVTASVSDGGGATGSAAIAVLVAASPGTPSPSIVLSVRAYKHRGLQRVDLTWSGATSGSVDVYRDGARIMTTPNDGWATDPIDRRGGGSYRYVVCAAGTTTCSTTVTASFR